MSFSHYSVEMPTTDSALPGRKERMPVLENHFVIGNPLHPPFPPTMQTAIFGMGCFWGPERKFWEQQGVYTTAVGYTAGLTPNPTYEEICSGLTGHSEVVQIVFDPMTVTYRELLILFWECHDPTQGMRQGNDMGTQYRSGIYTFSFEAIRGNWLMRFMESPGISQMLALAIRIIVPSSFSIHAKTLSVDSSSSGLVDTPLILIWSSGQQGLVNFTSSLPD